MIKKDVLEQYEPTIGIECHVQLNTKTKLFSAVSNDAVGKEPNTTVSPICFGLPGVLPVLNEAAINLAIKAGIALNAEVAKFSKFDRKHYFYPDLPKGYQITQFDQPTVGKGHVDIPLDGENFKVNITRAHLEEDAGKSTHPIGADYSLVDLNRAGTPLLEIVSEPDMHSAKQAKAFAQELYYLMKYADVSNVDLYHGNMRFDVNISVAKKGSKELGTRSEIKNLNSFRAVEKAVEYEIERQISLLEKGEEVVQETRGWDDAKQKTISQRGKEDSHDYRYFPEPDLPPVLITEEQIEEQRKNMPMLPSEIRNKLSSYGVDDDVVETLIGYKRLVDVLLGEKEQGASEDDMKRIANLLSNVVIAQLKENPNIDPEDKSILDRPGMLTKLSKMLEDKTIGSSAADKILATHFTDFRDPEEIAKEMDLLQMSDEAEIERVVKSVLNENKKAAEDVKNGEMKAIGFLVGQVMKQSKGKANPQMAQDLIKKQLGV